MPAEPLYDDRIDKHWRYGLAMALIISSFTLGMVCVFFTIPEGNQRLLDALFGGLITITGNAVLKAIDAARGVRDSQTIQSLGDQVAAATPPLPAGTDPAVVVQEGDVTIREK
jgi:hypothetical protein